MLIYEAKWDQGARDAYLKSHPQNFAGPDGSFPIRDASDVGDAWGLAGHAANPDAVRAKIKEIAARMGFSHALPDTAKEKQESAASVVDAGQRPRKKIATLKVCFLEYNARSLNGRIYPKVTCDRIYQSALRKIANNDLPATVFVSHEAANSNGNTELVGRVAKVWQEANKFYANLDLADTRAAWDMLALAENGALKSESMRVAGVELRHDNGFDVPLVVIPEGVEPDFLGIDLTTRPGLADSARILQTLYESQQSYTTEDFSIDNCVVESREEPPAMTIPIYVQAALGTLQEAKSSREAHTAIHDHIAGVMDECMGAKHGMESARYKALIEGQLDEAGKAIAMKHAARLAMAHDESAHQLGMKCEGCYADVMGNAPSDTDSDGDNPAGGFDPDHDGESHTPPALNESTKEDKTLTPEEMIAALKASGYQVEAPKTEEQKKLEALEALIAEQNAKIAQLQEAAPTSRQTLAAPSQLEESSTLQEEQMYEEGDYLKGQLAPKNWQALSNRRVPWPAGLDPKLALHEMAPFLAHTLNAQEAHARGRNIDAFIRPDEIM